MDIKPNFFSIIPANVRYDTDLKDKAKLLYGEISSLTNKFGYCIAKNEYFAELYDVSKETISRLISDLADKKYIKIHYDKNGSKVNKRYIYLCDYRCQNNQRSVDEIINGTVDENVKDNNTSINNKYNIYIVEILDYLNKKINANYKSSSKKTIQLITARLNEKFTVDDFKKVIDIKTTEWAYTDMAKYLRPETLFGNKFESYLNQKIQKEGVLDNGFSKGINFKPSKQNYVNKGIVSEESGDDGLI